jgi:hypothetical protein
MDARYVKPAALTVRNVYFKKYAGIIKIKLIIIKGKGCSCVLKGDMLK